MNPFLFLNPLFGGRGERGHIYDGWVSFDYRNEYRSINDTYTFKKRKVAEADEFVIAAILNIISLVNFKLSFSFQMSSNVRYSVFFSSIMGLQKRPKFVSLFVLTAKKKIAVVFAPKASTINRAQISTVNSKLASRFAFVILIRL